MKWIPDGKRREWEPAFLWVGSFLVSLIPALCLTAPAFEDGLGTMGTAAWLAGYDWSSFLAADGYYYKYGQTLWYLLPFVWIEDSVARYRVMLAVNSALASFIPVLAYRIGRRKLGLPKGTALAASLLAGWMPAVLLYSKYTWAETSLMLAPWVVLTLMLELWEGREPGVGKRFCLSVCLAAVCVYAFMCHQRGIVLLLAVVLAAVWLEVRRRGRLAGAAFLITLAAGLFLDRVISAWQKANVYAGAELAHNTLAHFLEPEIYRRLFSVKGLETVWNTAAGWLFYSAGSTFGLAFAGLAVMGVSVYGQLRQRREPDGVFILSLYALLSYFGALSLGLLFFFETMYGYFEGTLVERSDHLLFGRYLESTLPVLVFLGAARLLGMGNGKEARREGAVCLILFAGLGIYAGLHLLPLMEEVDCYVHSLMGMNLFMDTKAVEVTRTVIPGYAQALWLFALLSFAAALFWQAAGRGSRNLKRAAAAGTIVLFLFIYVWNCTEVIGRVDACGETVYAEYYRENG